MQLDSVAVVTGAAGGIGRALCTLLCRRGFRVYGLDLDLGGMTALQKDLSVAGGSFYPVRCSVTEAGGYSEALELLRKSGGRLRYWFNNAGIAGLGGFAQQSHETFAKVIEVNLVGLALGTRFALEYMEAAGEGTIVNIGSVAGHLPAPFLSAYVAAKHGVTGFTRSLQEELRLKNSPVKTCLVSPGFVETSMIQKGEKGGFPEWLSSLLASPESVAEEILRGLERGHEEIYPTFNGRMMLRLRRILPKTTLRSSRLLLTREWKDIFLNRYDPS